MTQDIDVVVDPRQLFTHLDRVLAELKLRSFLFEPSVVQQAIRDGGMFQLLDTAEALKLDIYTRELIPGELDRSEVIEVFIGVKLPIVSRADAAASKLVWISKGSHKSRRDLRQRWQ
ncbi:hypothetical protein ETAA8_14670 [Anatilimnocola aggregata]|uniref:Uncharacterized protein n=2 Tax=Anatilimnocola aggregata TaxID=2528021 RepID=A0A517Y819_9BACT|nr:hypothetical protein ETAA8_14670 [Anatilimnocola aggregata]